MIDHRLLNPDEMPAAVRLWVDVFGVEAAFFQTLLDGGDPDDFSVGAFDGDRIVSSVHVFTRWFRDREGRPQKVGGIGSVSTHPDHRKQGHSSKLLELAIEGMADRGCIWSYLGTGVNPHYARHGWRTVSTPYFLGAPNPAQTIAELETAQVTDALISQMAIVHNAYYQDRPMANDRSGAMWSHAVRYRITQACDEVFTRFEGADLVAYLVSQQGRDSVELSEAACQTGFDDALRALIQQRVALAAEQGRSRVISLLPEASPGHLAFQAATSGNSPREDSSWMVRPIAERTSFSDLAAMQADPRGRRSNLDNF